MKQPDMTGGEALINTLHEHGVEHVFGYSGGAALPIFDALATAGDGIELVLTRHEQGAAHMADGYARASGKPGVVLVTSGPGAGNVMTGLMTARMDNVPMVVISGQVPTHMLGLDAFQEADIIGMSAPVVKHNRLVGDTDSLAGALDEAFDIATSGRPGPVLLDVPKDVSSGTFGAEIGGPSQRPQEESLSMPDRQKVVAIADAWRRAERPVILAGHGVLISGAAPQLRMLAERQDTPVVTTLLGKGAFPENHRLSLGMLGMHGTAYANIAIGGRNAEEDREAIAGCDFLLNIGSRFDDRIVGNPEEFAKNAFCIAHVDIDPKEIGKIIEPDYGVVADAGLFLKAMIKELSDDSDTTADREAWIDRIEEYKQRYPLEYDTDGGLTMQHVIEAVHRRTAGAALVTSDVGQHQMWAAQFYKTVRPDTWLSSGGAGTMGFGLPAAIGAQFARPHEEVVAFVGDGGFQMTAYELATACNYNMPIKTFILNNSYLGMVRQWQEAFYDNRESGVDLSGNPDFVRLAESYGAAGIRITSADELEDGLEEAFAINDRPVVVDAEVVKADNVYPMISPGAAYTEMLLGAPQGKLEQPAGST